MARREITYRAKEYVETKVSPFRTHVERHTIFSLIGDPTGLSVIDAGCGDGIYARKLVELGAKHVIGVDCAEDFIALAKKKNTGFEGRIDYIRAFVQEFLGKGERDLVVGSFVLSYPKTLEEAVSYCRAMASHLKPGGRFVGFNNNPFDTFIGARWEKYGFKKVMTSLAEGAEVKYLVDGMDNPIVNYHLKPETYERAFRDAGFSHFEWQRVQLAPAESGNPYWDDFFRGEPPFIAMSAVK